MFINGLMKPSVLNHIQQWHLRQKCVACENVAEVVLVVVLWTKGTTVSGAERDRSHVVASPLYSRSITVHICRVLSLCTSRVVIVRRTQKHAPRSSKNNC
ncbi:hypothetical protein NP493_591g02050 [Ridgeia piscesae]|uniref:Uncharacterized protein n=1 Tax=Ridgeia piscesae TaxID=27915 RepID=A0AAD9KTU3_RIDPI|nr:hypothetical protein NP493_591g02050 [Ridgeia piscesae]